MVSSRSSDQRTFCIQSVGQSDEHLACNRNRLHPDAMILSTDRAGDPALAAGACARAWRRGALRCLQPRPLQHRCLDLPDRAGRVVVPRDGEDVAAALEIARDAGVSLCRAAAAPRNAVRPSAPRSCPRLQQYMNVFFPSIAASRRAVVQPGLVLDR